jgi:hypothetical protein
VRFTSATASAVPVVSVMTTPSVFALMTSSTTKKPTRTPPRSTTV